MALTKLVINHIRNIESTTLMPGAKFNLLFGKNGSGKTSVLESIYLLGMGRSFRTHSSERVISFDQPALSVFGILDEQTRIGIEKQRTGESRIRINRENQRSTASLAQLLPLQIINANLFQLIDAGPKIRRQFLDWGLFHVEHRFLPLWKQLCLAIRHRNVALRQQLPYKQIQAWDHEITRLSGEIDQLRCQYMAAYLPTLKEILAQLLELEVDIQYLKGWNKALGLEAVLQQSLHRDRDLGYTQYGPHRADLRITVKNGLAKDILSRGQQKVLLCALKLAQGVLLRRLAGKTCVYLIDDLAAELDEDKQTVFPDVLSAIDAQVFITAVELDDLSRFMAVPAVEMFHVEQGNVKLTPMRL